MLVQPGFFFDFEREAFLVISLLTAEDVFREGIRRILARGLARLTPVSAVSASVAAQRNPRVGQFHQLLATAAHRNGDVAQ